LSTNFGTGHQYFFVLLRVVYFTKILAFDGSQTEFCPTNNVTNFMAM